jgi:gamma-glutamyltranspeptidase/glutathione hydrolase
MPAAGDPWPFEGRSRPADYAYEPPPPIKGTAEPDTSYACAVDRWGNMFSVTPSDSLGMAPVAPTLGFTPSGRGTQTWLDPRHPSVLMPGKRPRLTPNALLAFKNGKPWMPFGTPGGDAQCQATLQYFLNMTVFGMTPQQAIEAPRFLTWSFPNSFWPHSYEPGRMDAEGRIPKQVVSDLEGRGHKVSTLDEYSRGMGDVCGIATDRSTGAVAAGADMRADAYAMAR